MHLIIIPGNSKEHNEQWLYDSEKAYKDLFESTKTHYYKHWETGKSMIDIDVEVEKLVKEVEGLDEYVIFAKSAGTVTTIKALYEEKILPKYCVFVGCPWGSFVQNHKDFPKALKKFNVPTLFIQQTDDMFFKYKDLKEMFDKYNFENSKIIEIPGENHSYDNYAEIKEWMKEFIE